MDGLTDTNRAVAGGNDKSPQAAPAVSILVISYNTREMTLACLRSIRAETTEYSYEIIVVDNASFDGSAAAIEDEFGDEVTLVESASNLGFAAANNIAAEHASAPFLLLLNPDTVVLDGAIDRLLNFARMRPDAGIWGGRTLFDDGALNPGSCWSRQTLWSLMCQVFGLTSIFRRSNLFNPEGIGGWNRQGERTVDIVSGCFLLITRELWQRLRGFDPAFFMYGEDADLCLRASALGARPSISGSPTIIHYGGASERFRADKLVRLLSAKAGLIRRHMPPPARAAGLLLLQGWPLSRLLAHLVLGRLRTTSTESSAGVWREVWRRRHEWSGAGSG